MTKQERLKGLYPILEKKFGNPKCALDYETPYQLMVAVILAKRYEKIDFKRSGNIYKVNGIL